MIEFYDPSQFEFVPNLETHWQIIQRELSQLHQNNFLAWPEKHLYGTGWDTFGLYAFGIRIGKNCSLCPETTKLVQKIPRLATAGFSTLAPGTHIAPHTGYPDGLLRCHLGVIIPETNSEKCGIRVGSETRHWEEGKCLIFSDKVEHEAWNLSERPRTVLLLDFQEGV
ncbi:aspartyl/asparaginyl beta-hydroxylase domain-containing protein [Pseudanabaena sp. FACHB-2040]|uniref:aspartyl/asparaginyl beta-hydroxylase domain-containing protein n=1 Tax=Pseudanabaena sp. FACHB-2040 TaxID=2692859 RepID=UPI001687EEDA|nr:aspartyl/asparaginyl beta-hydroxylase domain-containing protein [Pseudanabaena sp. FACHB-2040]MBD2261016.1 aspartyl/asparaginyl beta-hydroxylase domain-containing protein [Pseudanabaena sp. FACHB-2040]